MKRFWMACAGTLCLSMLLLTGCGGAETPEESESSSAAEAGADGEKTAELVENGEEGVFFCLGKGDTCPNQTDGATDLYCDECDSDDDNVEDSEQVYNHDDEDSGSSYSGGSHSYSGGSSHSYNHDSSDGVVGDNDYDGDVDEDDWINEWDGYLDDKYDDYDYGNSSDGHVGDNDYDGDVDEKDWANEWDGFLNDKYDDYGF